MCIVLSTWIVWTNMPEHTDKKQRWEFLPKAGFIICTYFLLESQAKTDRKQKKLKDNTEINFKRPTCLLRIRLVIKAESQGTSPLCHLIREKTLK